MNIGVDVGGTNLAAALVDDSGTILRRAGRPVDRSWSAEELSLQIAGLAREAADGSNAVETVGIGIPGVVDNAAGVVVQTPNMAFQNTPLRALFQREWDVPVYLGNDANCAAIGEYHAGSAKGCDPAVVLTLGTGIGGGLMINGKLFVGSGGSAMEVGHMVTHPDGLPCGCGSAGCWEQYGSATALIRLARIVMDKSPNSLLWQLCGGDRCRVQGRTVFQAAEAGDAAAMGALEQYRADLAIGLGNLINLLQPEVICLGGGISHAPDALLLYPLREAVFQYVFDKNSRVRLERASLGNDAGIIGAAMLCKSI